MASLGERVGGWLRVHKSPLLRLLWLVVLVVPFEVLRVHVSSDVRVSSNSDSDIHDAFGVIFNPLHDWLKHHEVTLQFFAALPLLIHYVCHLVLLVIFFHLEMWVGFEFLCGQLGAIIFQSIMGFPLPSTAILYSEKFWYLMETPGMDVGVNWHFFVGFLAARHAFVYYNSRPIKVVFAVHAILVASLTMSCRTTYTLSCLLAFVVYGATLWAKSELDGFLRRQGLLFGATDAANQKAFEDKRRLERDEKVLARQRKNAGQDQEPEVGHARDGSDLEDAEGDFESDDEHAPPGDTVHEVEMDIGTLLTPEESELEEHKQ